MTTREEVLALNREKYLWLQQYRLRLACKKMKKEAGV
jgi:hypothetical protein